MRSRRQIDWENVRYLTLWWVPMLILVSIGAHYYPRVLDAWQLSVCEGVYDTPQCHEDLEQRKALAYERAKQRKEGH